MEENRQQPRKPSEVTIRRVWKAELQEALNRTHGNIELAAAMATTMIFAD